MEIWYMVYRQALPSTGSVSRVECSVYPPISVEVQPCLSVCLSAL